MPGKKQKAFIGLMIGLMVAGILLGPLNTAIAENTGVQSVDNESVTADHDTAVDLAGWEIVSGTVRVFNATGDEVADSEYTIDHTPGTINVSSSSTSIADGEEITVTYDYEATDATTTLIAGFVVTLVLVVMIWYPVNWIQEHY